MDVKFPAEALIPNPSALAPIEHESRDESGLPYVVHPSLANDDFSVAIRNGADDEEPLTAIPDPVPHYGPPTTRRCELLAVPGQKFSIHYAGNSTRHTGNRRGAGIFAQVYIDDIVVETVFLPPSPGANGHSGLELEGEISGMFFWTTDGLPKQLPFRFGRRDVDLEVQYDPMVGSIAVVLCWAIHNDNLPNPFPPRTEALARMTALALRRPDKYPQSSFQEGLCVDLGEAEDSAVRENDRSIECVGDKKYTFVFSLMNWEGLPTPPKMPGIK